MKRGFSRKELLVVIAFLFVLAVILAPAFSRVRGKSNRIICIGNLKELGTAIRVWENDNTNKPPTSNAWSYYSTLMSGMGGNPGILTCPADERKPARTNEVLIDNSHLSYFIGLDAIDTDPQVLMGGDRNLAPGTTPRDDYGFSPMNGMGANVIVTTPVCWSLKMHSVGSGAGIGNIILGDGSVQETTSRRLRELLSTNSFRALFP